MAEAMAEVVAEEMAEAVVVSVAVMVLKNSSYCCDLFPFILFTE